MYGAAVANAYLYLFDERFTSGSQPLRSRVPRRLRRLQRRAGKCHAHRCSKPRRPAARPTRKRSNPNRKQWDVTVVINGGRWQADDFDRFEFVSDYEVRGLANQFHSYGLGRALDRGAQEPCCPSAPTSNSFRPS